MHDLDALEHYNSVELQNNWQHLQQSHIEPIHAATKLHHGEAFGLNVGTVQNPYSEEEEDEDEDGDEYDDEDDDEDDEEKAAADGVSRVVLDASQRNVYEWFEDELGECEPDTCSIFERTYRSRYDCEFEAASDADECYALNEKEQGDWLQRVAEVQYQRILDAMHTILFHSSARFD